MTINHSASFTDFAEFMAALEKVKAKGVLFNFSGSVNTNENDSDNFSINWTSEEEV